MSSSGSKHPSPDPLCPPEFVDPSQAPFVYPGYRGELPHIYKDECSYFVTFRLADAIPKRQEEQAGKMPASQEETRAGRMPASQKDPSPEEIARSSEVPLTLGSCVLKRADVAGLVRGALLFFERQRYYLHAWCIMANHVHVVLTPLPGYGLKAILHSWKSYTATQANRLLGTRGAFWERESFDHLIRSADHLDRFIMYTEENPVTAGLCPQAEDWSWSSRSSKPPP